MLLLALALSSTLSSVRGPALRGPAPRVFAVGECLWDGLPGGIFLGGSPLNVAAHLAARGAHATIACAIGNDRLGLEVGGSRRAAGKNSR